MNRFSGINLLRDDDPVLNRPMFARFANGGEVQAEETQIEDESDLGFTAPPLEVGPPPGTEAVKETIGLDQQPEVNQQMEQPIPEATSVPSAQSQTQSQMYSNKDKVMLALLPIAAELLNATTPKGQSNFSSFLSAAGRGLATIPRTLMGINQLQAKETRKIPTRKEVKFTKPFKFNNKIYSLDDVAMLTDEEINIISQTDPTALSFVPKPSKAGIKELSRSAIYMTPDEAEATFPNNPKIQSLVSTTDAGLVGSPVMKNNRAVVLKERYEGNQLINIIPSFASKQPIGKKDTKLSIARYQPDLESAKTFLEENGADENTTLGFNRIAEQLVNPDKAGQIVYEGGVAQRIAGSEADRAGAPLNRIILDPVKELKNPSAVATREYVKKLSDQLQDAQTSYDELGPRINTILQILPDTKTGVVEAGLLPFRRVFLNILGASAEQKQGVSNLELLKQSSDAIAPLMRKAGAGSTSDMEFDAYRNAALNIKNTNMANYVNLFMLKKMKENAIDNSILRLDLIAKDENITQRDIKAEVDKKDKGIFAKYEGDPEDTSALQSWFTSLPRGTVILNKDKNGKPILSSNDNPLGTFVVTDGQGGFLFED